MVMITRLMLLIIELQQRPYPVYGCTPKEWIIGKGFIDLDDMFLVKFESVSDGSWQPEIWVKNSTI